jgi:hypothetical protein
MIFDHVGKSAIATSSLRYNPRHPGQAFSAASPFPLSHEEAPCDQTALILLQSTQP